MSHEIEPHQDPAITAILRRWSRGDAEAAEQAVSLVYQELHRLALSVFRGERRDHTLQATAIVNEAYVRLIELPGIEWQNRQHFLAFAARLMRRVLVDHARHRNRAKRGGKVPRLSLAEAEEVIGQTPTDMMELDDALKDLEQKDAQMAAVVELRFFGGLTLEEAAEYLKISPVTVSRKWRRAKAWLYAELQPQA